MLNRNQAIDMLGHFAINQLSGKHLDSRIDALIEFSKDHPGCEIVVNNNWANPATPSRWKAAKRLGGTTYKYQVWAVSPKD